MYEYTDDLEQEVFEYLDWLRESGETNMFGAAPWIRREFAVGRREARAYLARWMDTFNERNSED